MTSIAMLAMILTWAPEAPIAAPEPPMPDDRRLYLAPKGDNTAVNHSLKHIEITNSYVWIAAIKSDGSGLLRYDRDQVILPPGTFDIGLTYDRLRPHLATTVPGDDSFEQYWNAIVVKGEDDVSQWRINDIGLLADVFELFRQMCRRQAVPSGSALAHHWRRWPPTSLSKPWDAPVAAGPAQGLAIPPHNPHKNQLYSPSGFPLVAIKLNYVYWNAQIRADGSAIFGEKLGRSGYLLPGTFQVRGLIDWLKPHVENLDDGLPGNVQFLGDDGEFKRYYPPSDEVMASLFEMFRYAFKRQQSHYPPVEESWYLRQPAGGSRPWNYPLFWNPLMERLLAPSLRPTADMEAKARQFRDPLFWAATGYWEVIIQPDGAGSVVCRDGDANQEPRPVFEVAKAVFPPGSFKLDAHLPRWRPRLSDTKPDAPWMYAVFALPDPAGNDRLVQFPPLGPDDGSGVAPLAEVFELVRQTCQREKPVELAAIAEHWKKHPPLEHYSTERTKPWDAPLDEQK